MAPARQPARNRVEKAPPDPVDLAPHLRERRARIVDVAREMLEHDEYDAIQIREVAEQAGVALGTLYRYFASKEHLYAAVLFEWMTGLDTDARRLAEDGSDEDRIRALLLRAVKAFERSPNFYRAHIAIEASTDPHAKVLYEQFSDRYLDALLTSMRETTPSDANAIVTVVSSVLSNQLRQWALGRRTITEVRNTIDRSVTLVFHGAQGRK